jgi:polysaccharide deacetylase 2 family uncharacterized protein YibQ
MKRRKSEKGKGNTGKRWRWGPLMLGAFLAGLFTIGAVILMPGGENRTGAFSPAQEVPSAVPAAPGGGVQNGMAPRQPFPPDGAVRGEGTPPRLAIVVDDCGYDPPRDAEWLKFPEKITLAVIPFGPSSRRLAQSAHERGFGVMIHVPMEPEGSVSDRTESFRLRRGMRREEMETLLDKMTEENPWATGASNYMGSAFTADPESMTTFVSLLKSKGLFLLDSMTTSRSVAVRAALQAGIPVARRDVSLDADMEPEEMRLQWKKGIAIAKEKGTAVLLCHGGRESLRTMLDLVPDLEAEGVRAVTLAELLAPVRSL